MKNLNNQSRKDREWFRTGSGAAAVVALWLCMMAILPMNALASGNVGIPVKGIIRDDKGEPLAGANIYLKGKEVGTVTDVDGKFEFPVEVQPGDIIVVSFIGFEKVEYTVPQVDLVNLELNLVQDALVAGESAVDEVYDSRQHRMAGLWSRIKGIF